MRGQHGPIPADCPPAWRAAMEGYENHCRAAGHSVRTIGNRRYWLLWRLAPSNPDPWAVTGQDVLELLGRDYAPETRKSIRNAMTSFYGWAARSGRIEVDPTRDLPKVRVPAGKPRPAPFVTLCRAIDMADTTEVAWLLLASLAGLRRLEVATLRVEDVEADHLRITGKGGVVRTVPLHPDLDAVLRPLLPRSGYVFPGQEDGHVSADHVGRRIGNLLGGRYSAHTLRHAAASAWYAVERDILAVRDLLGHASVATTQRYVATPQDAARRAVLGR